MLGRVDLREDQVSYLSLSLLCLPSHAIDEAVLEGVMYPLSSLTLNVLNDLPIADRLRSHSQIVSRSGWCDGAGAFLATRRLIDARSGLFFSFFFFLFL